MERFIPLIGLATMVLFCLAISRDRRTALKNWHLIAWGLGLQFIFAVLILATPIGRPLFAAMNHAFIAILDSAKAGSKFVFGQELGDPGGSFGPLFAFNILPVIIFFSSLSAILYHWGILQKIVGGVAWVMARTMKTSGAETLSAAANVFLGQSEAPLLVRPFIDRMTKSELMTVMTGGFATVAGTVMAAYVAMLSRDIPGIAGHLMAASVLSAPAALMFGKLLVPETEVPETAGMHEFEMPKRHSNTIEAATDGVTEGVKLAVNVAAMLIGFLALIALINLLLGFVGGGVEVALGAVGVSLPEGFKWEVESLVGYLFAPLAILIGIPPGESVAAGQLLGIKTVANEFVAFAQMQGMTEALSPRSRVIMAYALAGFANIGSIGIMIGFLVIIAPSKRLDIVRLGFPAMFAGLLAACSTACVAGFLYQSTPTAMEGTAAVESLEAAAAVAGDPGPSVEFSWRTEVPAERHVLLVWPADRRPEEGDVAATITPAAATDRASFTVQFEPGAKGMQYRWRVETSGAKDRIYRSETWSFTLPEE